MLDRLGLGIVLGMEDEFTPAVNNALRSFTRLQDGAESMAREVSRSMVNLQNLMLAGFSFTQVGGQLERTGAQIIGVFRGIAGQILETNRTFENYRRTMSVFFKNENVDDVLKWGVKFSGRTPFEIPDAIQALQSFKAIGIDVRKEFEYVNKEGQKAKKSFLDFVGDLGAMRSDQGVSGAMMAIRNLIGGNDRSLQMRFDIDPELILGRKIDTSNIEKVQYDLVEMISKLAPDLMKGLEGSFDQLMSNLRDTWTYFKWQLGDAGVWNAMKKTIIDVTAIINSIDIEKVVKPLGELVSTLWKPFHFFVTGIASAVKWIMKMVETYPTISRFVGIFVMLGAVGMTLTGVFMNLTGSTVILATSIISMLGNLAILKTVSTESVLPSMGNITGAFSRLIRTLSLTGLVAFGFYSAWKNNMWGMRESTTGAFANLRDEWAKADIVIEAGMKRFISYSRENNIRVTNFTLALAKFKLLLQAVSTIFFSKLVDGKSVLFLDEHYSKYQEFGLLGVVHALVRMRGRIEAFFSGMLKGISLVYKITSDFLKFVLTPIKIILTPIYNAFMGIGKATGLISISEEEGKSQVEMWKNIGSAVGGLLGVFLGFKVVSTLTSVITAPFKAVTRAIQTSTVAVQNFKDRLMGMSSNALLVSGNAKYKQILSPFVKEQKILKDKEKLQATHRKLEMQAYMSGNKNWRIPLPADLYAPRTRRDRVKDAYSDKVVTAKTTSGSIKGFERVLPESIFRTYRDYSLHARGIIPDNLHTKGGFLSGLRRTLFGDTYYTPTPYGGMSKVGSFGGLLRLGRSDNALKLAVQDSFAKSGQAIPSGFLSLVAPKYRGAVLRKQTGADSFISEVVQQRFGWGKTGVTSKESADSYRHMVKPDGSMIGTLATMKGYNYGQQQKKFGQDYSLAKIAHGAYVGERFARMRELEQHYLGTRQGRQALYQLGGRSGRSFGNNNRARDAYLQEMFYRMVIPNDAQMKQSTELAKQAQRNMVHAQQAGKNLKTQSQAPVYVDKNRSTLRNLMFGQNMYTVEYDENGNPRKRAVGRRGGIFRRRSQDGVYKPPNPNSFMARMGRGVSSFRGAIGGAIGSGLDWAGGRLGAGAGAIGNFLGRMSPMPFLGRALDSQLSRFGSSRTDIFGGGQSGQPGLLSRMGTGMRGFLLGTKSPTGKVIKPNLLGRVGGGLKKGLGVAGGLATGLMSGLMYAQIASSLFTALSGGEGLKGVQKRFTGWAEWMKKEGGKQLPKMWDNFKETAKVVFRAIGVIGKELWEYLKSDGGRILGDMWNLVKEAGKLAWEWLVTDGARMFGQLVSWVISSGVPMFIKALLKIGVWLLTDGVPGIIGLAGKLISNLAVGIFNGIVGLFAGMFTAVKNFFDGFIKWGWLRKLLGLEPITVSINGKSTNMKTGPTEFRDHSVVVSHRGHWMAPYETPSIIRKDETVLPPNISKGFNDIIRNGKTGSKAPQTVDNSTVIEKVDVTVVAGKLSRAEAREQALMIIEEVEKIKKEKGIRNFGTTLATAF